MRFTVRALLRTDRKNTSGLCPVNIAVTQKGKVKKISLQISVKEDEWDNAKERVRPAHRHAASYNAKITKKISELETALIAADAAGTPLALTQLARLDSPGATDFIAYAEDMLPKLKMEASTRRRWGYSLEHVKEYSPELPWQRITPQWLHRFNKHLCTKMHQNTAIGVFKLMRRLFNEAYKDGTWRTYPFARNSHDIDKFHIPAEVAPDKTYLTMDELERIEALLDNGNVTERSMRSTIAHFLLECYCGLRHSDWGKWQTERLVGQDSFKLTTTKTGELIYIPLEEVPKMKALIARIRAEGLAYTATLEDANRKLKAVGMAAGISKRMTTHLARHTAGTMLSALGFTTEEVAAVLGISEATARVYTHMTGEKIKRAFVRINRDRR